MVLIDVESGILISVQSRPSVTPTTEIVHQNGVPGTADGDIVQTVAELSPCIYASSSPTGSQLLVQGASSVNSTMKWLERGRRIERLTIRPRALFGSDPCIGMANSVSLLQSLLGLGASAFSASEIKLYHRAFTVANSPAFTGGVKEVRFYRMLPSPGSLSIEPSPAMRMASIFGRLGTTCAFSLGYTPGSIMMLSVVANCVLPQCVLTAVHIYQTWI
jgi:hypothetical protein